MAVVGSDGGKDSGVSTTATAGEEECSKDWGLSSSGDKSESKHNESSESAAEDGDAKMGVSQFLKQQEDKQKEEAERLAREIREEKERKEKREAEAKKAREEAERLEKERKEKEEQERAEKERKEKQAEIRKMYELPDTPHIIVHPQNNDSTSSSADSVKYRNVSFSSLLDKVYAESKEDAFTLEVFAESLYEMLQRDFCYEIYRALEHAKDPEVERKKKEMEEKKKREEEEAAARKTKEEEEERVKREAEAAELKQETENGDGEKEEGGEEMEGAEGLDKLEGEENTGEADENEDCSATPPPKKKLRSDVTEGSRKSQAGGLIDETAEPITDDEADEKETAGAAAESKCAEEDIVVKKKLVPKTVYPQLLLAFSFFDRSFSGYIKQRDLEDCVDALGLGLSKQQVKYLVGKVSKLDLVNYQEMTDETVEEGVDAPYKYYTHVPLGNVEHFEAAESSAATSSGGDFVQYKGATINIGNLMRQSEQLQTDNNVLKSRVTDLEKDNGVLKSKFDAEALESASLSKKLTDTKYTLAQTASANAQLTRTQESLKKLLKDNAATLEDTVVNINKKLTELESAAGEDVKLSQAETAKN